MDGPDNATHLLIKALKSSINLAISHVSENRNKFRKSCLIVAVLKSFNIKKNCIIFGGKIKTLKLKNDYKTCNRNL